MWSWRRFWAVARKEGRQLRRDTHSLALAFLLPLLLALIFGYAINWDVDHIPLGLLDQDRSAQSRALTEAFQSSGYFTLAAHLERSAQISPLLDQRGAQLVLVIPPDFSRRLGAGKPAELQAVLDGSDANTATIALGYAEAIVHAHAARAQLRGTRLHPPAELRSRVWYNEERRSRNMIVPGLVAVIMMVIAGMLTSLTVAREWERGTLEQLAATPVGRAELVLGKLLPYVAIGFVDVAVTCLLGVFAFGVPFRGSPLLLAAFTLVFLVGTLGMGLLISAASKSQLLATQLAMLATFTPAFFFSGFMYEISVMPPVLRAITYLVPARYYLTITRGVFLKGVGMDVLYRQGLLLAAFAALSLFLAVRAFKKELG